MSFQGWCPLLWEGLPDPFWGSVWGVSSVYHWESAGGETQTHARTHTCTHIAGTFVFMWNMFAVYSKISLLRLINMHLFIVYVTDLTVHMFNNLCTFKEAIKGCTLGDLIWIPLFIGVELQLVICNLLHNPLYNQINIGHDSSQIQDSFLY